MSYIGNSPITQAFLTDQFSGNGSTTAFTMTVAPATTSSILVSVTGVLQDPSTYSVSGTTLTFSAAPPTGTGNISVRYLGIPASGVTTTAYRTLTEFTATAGQTTFTPPSYTVGFLNVYRNGVRLGSADYTATNGTTVVLASGASVGDLVTTESFYVSSVLNAIPNNSASVQQTNIASGVAGTGPAFSAAMTATHSVSNATVTAVQFNTDSATNCFDTNSNFDTSTYRFTPTVAGYYQFSARLATVSSDVGITYIYIIKNGTDANNGLNFAGRNSASGITVSTSGILYMNGSTDYVAAYVYQNSGGTATIGSTGFGYANFQGALVRSA